MKVRTLRVWKSVHTWTSLICTLFLFVLCLTGLPLIFHDEIDRALGAAPVADAVDAATPLLSLDRILEIARKERPNEVVTIVGADDEDPIWHVNMAKTLQAATATSIVSIDGRTGRVIQVGTTTRSVVIKFLLDLHRDMFLGEGGMLFLGGIGVCFLGSIVSGVVVYGPFMRRIDFGTVRARRRLHWLDLHNLLGAVILAWMVVVGVTGIINTLSDQIARHWRKTELVAMIGPYRDAAVPVNPSSAQAAIETALAQAPSMKVGSVALPGSLFAGGRHYGVYLRGSEPLTSRLLKPVLIDAQTGAFAETRDMPWYVTALFVSRPLHFGDYGEWPLKLIWVVLDVMTLLILGSGLYLWIARTRAFRIGGQRAAAASHLASQSAEMQGR